tara:strand:+ start:1647 stop:1829 length:183 start_codon:yes stop_codon:yes gene_type:complete
MVSFARARTRSLLSKLWPLEEKPLNNQKVDSSKSKKQQEDILEQNKCFLESIKNGGMWFS